MKRVGVIGAPIGNTPAIMATLRKAGVEAILLGSPKEVSGFERLVLPGVGHFGAFVSNLIHTGFFKKIREVALIREVKILGICVGAQALFDGSEEANKYPGLGLIEGQVLRLTPEDSALIPRVGWDRIQFANGRSQGHSFLEEEPIYYFNHSFFMKPHNLSLIAASSTSDPRVPAIVINGNIFAAQFHPERSGLAGQRFLHAYASGALDAS